MAPAVATAEVFTFEDIPLPSDSLGIAYFPSLGIQNSYLGWQWPTESGARHWGVVESSYREFGTVGALSGTKALFIPNGGPVRNIIFDRPYDVAGAWFNVFEAQKPWGAATVQLNGYDSSGVLIGTSGLVSLDRINPHPSWQLLIAGFSGVKRLEIVSTEDSIGGYWTMDNLDASPTIVPEPSTLALAALGALGLLIAARRRR